MKNRDGWWVSKPVGELPIGPMFPKREVEAARERVVVKRRVRRMLAAAGITGVEVR